MNQSKNYVAPGTVSNILWHFTGGPKWDDVKKKQLTIKKPDIEAFNNLKSILKTKELRLGSYKEIIKYVIPKQSIDDLDQMKKMVKKNEHKIIESNPICCVAEIPIQHLSFHAKRYGKFAIGFYRDSLIKNAFRPVRYSMSNDTLIYDLITAYKQIILIKNDMKSLPATIDEYFIPNPIKRNPRSMKILRSIILNHAKSIEYMEKVISIYLSYIKTITKRELKTTYCEREWRSLTTYNFIFDDVAFIIIPKAYFNKDYDKEIVDSSEKLDIPRSIPIIPWEDLIEE